MYAAVSRFELNPMLSLYDFPDANVHAARRVSTTTPLQKLFVTNHPFVIRQAEAIVEDLAEQRVKRPGRRDHDAVPRGSSRRQPLPTSASWHIEFLADSGENRRAAWVQYAHALLASNELLFVD